MAEATSGREGGRPEGRPPVLICAPCGGAPGPRGSSAPQSALRNVDPPPFAGTALLSLPVAVFA